MGIQNLVACKNKNVASLRTPGSAFVIHWWHFRTGDVWLSIPRGGWLLKRPNTFLLHDEVVVHGFTNTPIYPPFLTHTPKTPWTWLEACHRHEFNSVEPLLLV